MNPENATATCCDFGCGKKSPSATSVDLKKILTGLSGLTTGLAFVLSLLPVTQIAVTILYVVSIILGGIYVVRGALRGLIKQKFLNIDFLVVIATLGALYINQLAEAAAVIFFFSLSEALEEFGVSRSQKALQSLLHTAPQTATLLTGAKVPVADVQVGQKISVRPGDLIPLDGKVITGSSAVDEATITGESIPKDKREGDSVFAGTMNKNGYLEIEVVKTSANSTFSKIVTLIEQAQQAKAPSQEFIDRFAKYYTPAVVILAGLVTIVPPLLLGQPLIIWFTRALVLLVIACPCALVISTPVAITSAIGGASRRGVLVKGGKYLEKLQSVRAIAFDKTGTLTLGQPYLSDVITFNGYSEKDVLEDAAGIEQFSSHPLSKSILDFSRQRGISPHGMKNYENFAGKGGKADCLVCNDLEHCVGNLKLMNTRGVSTPEIVSETQKFEREGKTTVLVSEAGKLMGALAIADKIRDEAKQVISKITDLDVIPVMLTGDNQYAAGHVGNQVGVTTIYSSLLPDEKVKKIQELKEKYGVVAMVGDGINDAPSLALADVGIAMASRGSDIAIETADIALMNENLLHIPRIIGLGKKTVRTIKQNITAALLAKIIFAGLAVFGISNLSIAIAADTGVALLVIINSLRLFRF